MDIHYFLQDAHGAYYAINGPTAVGRDSNCQIKLADPEVSRNHALLWIDRRNLYIRDENTSNGTYLNDNRIPSNQPIALASGSQLRFGGTFFTVVNLEPAAAQTPATVRVQPPVSESTAGSLNKPSKLSIYLILLVGALCLGALILAVGYLFLKSRAASQDFPGITVVATSAPHPLLAPREFADGSGNLALAIAKLNTAELVFVRHAEAASPDSKTLDGDLCEMAAQAMNVALLAERLARTAASQNGKSAEQYYSIARVDYALVIEAQNLRRGLQNQTVAPAQALKTIAQYGIRLWNPMVSTPGKRGNPFLTYVAGVSSAPSVQFLSDEAVAQLKLGSGGQIQTWMASSAEMETIQLDLPSMGKPFTQPPGLALLQSLTQASAQAESDVAQQAAAMELAMLLPFEGPFENPESPFSMQVMVLSGTAFVDGVQIEAGNVPTFPKGQASALTKQTSGDDSFVNHLYTLGGDAAPVEDESTPIKETQPVVSIQITGAKETGRTPSSPNGYSGFFDVQVTWQSTFTSSVLDIGCLGGNTQRVSGQSGTVKINAAAYIHPSTNEASIQCRASRPVNFVDSIAEAGLVVTVASGQNVELVPPPPTVTETLPPTVTQTLEPSETPTPNKTEWAVGTEVAAQQTAEFLGTVTAIAAQTQQSAAFTMNGTFSINKPQQDCTPPLFTSGILKINVNFGAGTASGSLNGSGSKTTMGIVCGDITYDMACDESYDGKFSGSVDPASGALSISGNVNGKRSCTFSNCKQFGVEFACQPGSAVIADQTTITGTVNQSSGTGNGIIQSCPGCTGDWSAGK